MCSRILKLVENHTCNKIKILRTDNGGEYISNEFSDFHREAEIKKVIVPYNPQQTGVAERKNKTIVEATKAMIHDQKLTMFLFGEATNVIVYVQNRSPHHSSGNKALEEIFIGMNLKVGHLRIFGCPIYFVFHRSKPLPCYN